MRMTEKDAYISGLGYLGYHFPSLGYRQKAKNSRFQSCNGRIFGYIGGWVASGRGAAWRGSAEPEHASWLVARGSGRGIYVCISPSAGFLCKTCWPLGGRPAGPGVLYGVSEGGASRAGMHAGGAEGVGRPGVRTVGPHPQSRPLCAEHHDHAGNTAMLLGTTYNILTDSITGIATHHEVLIVRRHQRPGTASTPSSFFALEDDMSGVRAGIGTATCIVRRHRHETTTFFCLVVQRRRDGPPTHHGRQSMLWTDRAATATERAHIYAR